MDDIYGNLENYEDENRLESLEKENLELKTKVISITNDITHLQAEYDFLKSEFDKMKANYSSLLKTAKAEIDRKTKMISALNTEKDQLIIGFINDSTYRRYNPNRYIAKARTTVEASNKNLKEQSSWRTVTNTELGDRKNQDNTSNSEKSTAQEQIVNPSWDTKANSINNTHNKKDCKENVQVFQYNETSTDHKSSLITKRRKTLPALSERSASPQRGSNDEEEPTSTKSTLKHNNSEVPPSEERFKHTKFYNRKYERNHDFERRKEQYESRYNRGRSPHDDRDSRRYGRSKFQERDFRNKGNNRNEYDRRRVIESPPPDLQRTRNRYRPHERQDHIYAKPRYSEPDHKPPNQRCDSAYDKHRQTKVINRQSDLMEEDNISAKFSEEEESSTLTFTDDRRTNPEPDPRLFSNRYVEVYDNRNSVATISTVRGRNVDLKLLKYDQNIYVEKSSQVTNIGDCANDNLPMRTEIRRLSVESGDPFEEPHIGKGHQSETSHNVKSSSQYKTDDLQKPFNEDKSSSHGNNTNSMVMIPENEQYYDRVCSKNLSPEDISSTSVKNQLFNDLSLCPVKKTDSKEQNVTSTSEVSEDSKKIAILTKKVVQRYPHATKDIKRCHSVADDLELSDENSDCNDTMSPAKRDSNKPQDTSLEKLHNKDVDESSLITLEDLDLPVKSQSKILLDIEESQLPIICADTSKSDNSTEMKDKGTSVKEVARKENIKTETKSSRKRKNKEDLNNKDVKKTRPDTNDKKKCHKETRAPKADEDSNRKSKKNTTVGIEPDKSHRDKNNISTPDNYLKQVDKKTKTESHEHGDVPKLVTKPRMKIKENITKKVEEIKKPRREVVIISIPLDKEKSKKKRQEETRVSEPKKISLDGSSDPTKNVTDNIKNSTTVSTISNNTNTDQQVQTLKLSSVLTTEISVATTKSSVYKDILDNNGDVMSNERLTDNTKICQQELNVSVNKNIHDNNNSSTKHRESKKRHQEVTIMLPTEKTVATTEPSVYKNIENSGDVMAHEPSTCNTTTDQQNVTIESSKNTNNDNDSTKLREPEKNHEVACVSVSSPKATLCSNYKNIIENISMANERVNLDATSDVSDTCEINLSNNSSSSATPIGNSSKPGNPPPDVRIVMKRRSRPIMRKPTNTGP